MKIALCMFLLLTSSLLEGAHAAPLSASSSSSSKAAAEASKITPLEVFIIIDGSLFDSASLGGNAALRRLIFGFKAPVIVAIVAAGESRAAVSFCSELSEDDISCHAKPMDVLMKKKKPTNPESIPQFFILFGITRAQLAWWDFRDNGVIEVQVSQLQAIMWLTSLDTVALSQWRVPEFHVVVITQYRVEPLKRLLSSLANAYYFADTVHIHFSIDKHSTLHAESDALIKTVSAFEWPHGQKNVQRRIVPGGLISAVTESWYPGNEHSYGVLLEDDIEVSPYWFQFAKSSVLMHQYSATGPNPSLVGVSLYSPRILELHKSRQHLDFTHMFKDNFSPFLYQTPCSWGAVYFPRAWQEFHDYMSLRLRVTDKDAKKFDIPTKPTSNGWKGSWKKFFIEMMYGRGFVMLYPNLANQTSFSTNHLENGEHNGPHGHSELEHLPIDYTVPLVQYDDLDMLEKMPLLPISKLPVLDMFATQTTLTELADRGKEWTGKIVSCSSSNGVLYDAVQEPICYP